MAPLREVGVVQSGTLYSSRSTYWWSPEITDALDDFAMRAGAATSDRAGAPRERRPG